MNGSFKSSSKAEDSWRRRLTGRVKIFSSSSWLYAEGEVLCESIQNARRVEEYLLAVGLLVAIESCSIRNCIVLFILYLEFSEMLIASSMASASFWSR